MRIEELKGGEVEEGGDFGKWSFVGSDTKRVLVGAGARALFYPTLVYNVVRNRLQAEFRWWDKVDEVGFHIGLLICYCFLCWYLMVSLHACFYLIICENSFYCLAIRVF